MGVGGRRRGGGREEDERDERDEEEGDELEGEEEVFGFLLLRLRKSEERKKGNDRAIERTIWLAPFEKKVPSWPPNCGRSFFDSAEIEWERTLEKAIVVGRAVGGSLEG